MGHFHDRSHRYGPQGKCHVRLRRNFRCPINKNTQQIKIRGNKAGRTSLSEHLEFSTTAAADENIASNYGYQITEAESICHQSPVWEMKALILELPLLKQKPLNSTFQCSNGITRQNFGHS